MTNLALAELARLDRCDACDNGIDVDPDGPPEDWECPYCGHSNVREDGNT